MNLHKQLTETSDEKVPKVVRSLFPPKGLLTCFLFIVLTLAAIWAEFLVEELAICVPISFDSHCHLSVMHASQTQQEPNINVDSSRRSEQDRLKLRVMFS